MDRRQIIRRTSSFFSDAPKKSGIKLTCKYGILLYFQTRDWLLMGPVWAERTDFQPVCDLAWAPHHPTLRVRPRVSLPTTLPGWVSAFGGGGRWRVNADIWCLTVWSWGNVEQVEASADPGRHHFPATANLQVGHPSSAGVRVRALDNRYASYVTTTMLQIRGGTISIF